MHIRQIFILLIAYLSLTACFHSSGGAAVGLELEADSHLIWQLGEPYQLYVKAVDSSGEKAKKQPEFVWSSLDESIAVVDQNGVVTALSEGVVTIRVEGGKFKEDIELLVDTTMQDVHLQINYEDRLYDTKGFTTTKLKPVRFVKVEFVNEGSYFITEGRTDAAGKLTASIPKSGDVAVRIISELQQEKVALSVKDMSRNYYSIYKALDMNNLNDTVTVDISLITGAAGAFNILDVFSVASEFSHSFNADTNIALNAYWQPDNLSGTFFCTNGDDPACVNGKGIYVLSVSGDDTDEFDDDVLWHEFGHYIASEESKDQSPGGCHYFDMNDLDLRLAWSEGWGDFFPMAVKNWAAKDVARADYVSMDSSVAQSFYVDTAADLAQLSFDVARLENNGDVEIDKVKIPFEEYHVHASSELAVSKILWDTLSAPNFGMSTIWDVFDNYLEALDASTIVNLESFWDGLLVQLQPADTELAELEQIFGERKVYYRADQYEANDTIASATALSTGSLQTHYLYSGTSAGDTDYVYVNLVAGQNYEVLTSGLTSGADTYIYVLDEAGDVINIDGVPLQNDDWRPEYEYQYSLAGCGYIVSNNKTALSSRVEFRAPYTGRYYVKVQSTAVADPPPYDSAGRYGTYDLKVSVFP
ncbi:MAG: Ig-like domain-containing protein [Gammaproteobacteria bacterium]|nr:Ig-like domain-containing protein [Gammaproteobacteria bacterium]